MDMIEVYMPTSDHDDEGVDVIYDEIEKLLEEEKGNICTVVMGDWNAVVGAGRDEKTVGLHGLGNQNRRGVKLIEFCNRKKLVVCNTWFQQHVRRKYTWKNRGDTQRYQIDYILINNRYKNSVKDTRAYPDADADTDHNLVTMKANIRLKTVHVGKQLPRWNREKIKGSDDERYREAMEETARMWQDHISSQDPNQKWESMKLEIKQSAFKHIGK